MRWQVGGGGGGGGGVSGPQMGSRTAPSGGFPYGFNTVGCLGPLHEAGAGNGPARAPSLLNSGSGPIEQWDWGPIEQ